MIMMRKTWPRTRKTGQIPPKSIHITHTHTSAQTRAVQLQIVGQLVKGLYEHSLCNQAVSLARPGGKGKA